MCISKTFPVDLEVAGLQTHLEKVCFSTETKARGRKLKYRTLISVLPLAVWSWKWHLLSCVVSTNNWSRWWSLISWCSTQKSMNVNQEPPKCMQFLELCWSKVLEEALQRLLRWHGALPVTLLPLQGGCTWAENVTKKQTELSLFSIEYVILIQGGLYHTAKSSWRPPQQYYQNLSTPGGCWAQCHKKPVPWHSYWLNTNTQGPLQPLANPPLWQVVQQILFSVGYNDGSSLYFKHLTSERIGETDQACKPMWFLHGWSAWVLLGWSWIPSFHFCFSWDSFSH